MNRFLFSIFCLIVILSLQACDTNDKNSSSAESFSEEQNVNPGINKYFKDPDLDPEVWAGRFTGESREVFTQRNKVLEALNIQPGDRIADIGAGSGLYIKLFAEAVENEGTVYAVDIAQSFLDFIEKKAKSDGLTNVKTVLGQDKTANLSDSSVDIIFHSDTYHHFEYPASMNKDLARSLVSGGDLYVLDFKRIEGVSSDFILGHVRAGKEVVISEIESSGFVFVEEIDMPDLKENYLLHFSKR